jgi:hypothetical protein
MMRETDYQRHNVLTMIESAQRAGRSENEIVAIVDRYFGMGQARVHGLAGERRLLRRLRERGFRRAA